MRFRSKPIGYFPLCFIGILRTSLVCYVIIATECLAFVTYERHDGSVGAPRIHLRPTEEPLRLSRPRQLAAKTVFNASPPSLSPSSLEAQLRRELGDDGRSAAAVVDYDMSSAEPLDVDEKSDDGRRVGRPPSPKANHKNLLMKRVDKEKEFSAPNECDCDEDDEIPTTLTTTGITRPQQQHQQLPSLPLLVTPASVTFLPQQQVPHPSQPAATGSVDDFLVDTLKRVIMEFKKSMKKQQRPHRKTNHKSAVTERGQTTAVASVNAEELSVNVSTDEEPEADFRRRSPQRNAGFGRQQ